jgi:hypothetical protein
MAHVWPERIVDENNLQWQISALRVAFGSDRNLIRTVSGRIGNGVDPSRSLGARDVVEVMQSFGKPNGQTVFRHLLDKLSRGSKLARGLALRQRAAQPL